MMDSAEKILDVDTIIINIHNSLSTFDNEQGLESIKAIWKC